MREILFRGKRKDNGEWVYGLLCYNIYGDLCIQPYEEDCPCVVILPETVGQYTGLTDKNGKKIFEGDIVDGYDARGKHTIFKSVVKWNEFFAQWTLDKHQSMYGDSIVFSYEIIGNIHDNPELLKGSDSNA